MALKLDSMAHPSIASWSFCRSPPEHQLFPRLVLISLHTIPIRSVVFIDPSLLFHLLLLLHPLPSGICGYSVASTHFRGPVHHSFVVVLVPCHLLWLMMKYSPFSIGIDRYPAQTQQR